ncbi:MAG: multidrug DMT transporter permease [Pseudomonas qingdaonensis]|uniref:multidrug DMT transporter permease n=1 Tax=Pseudomonas qingdaonensis TaxID=2056231 RepID=UPI003314CAD3
MQELAALLGDSGLRAETEIALVQLMKSRKLEAEVVEVLCIFWMAAQAFGYLPTPMLAETFTKPSILSDMLLESLGVLREGDVGELEEVPENFEIPQDFNGVQGTDLPRIFRTSMRELESNTRLPFVRQMAFEWMANRATYPDAPFQGDSWHFLGPLGEGFIGQLSSRTALRAISAYLRTLAVAEKFWAMPTDLAEKRAILALPIHPTLAFLKPQRPIWFPATTDFDGNTQEIETSLRALIERVQATRSGDELIAFSSPIAISMERSVEVSIVRWSQAMDGAIADADLSAQLEDLWAHGRMLRSMAPEPLSTTTVLVPPDFDGLMEGKCKAWPLAVPLGIDRIGYLQHDLYPGRLFLPTLPGSDQAELTPRGGQLEIKVGEQVFADLCYWNAGWGSARPMQFVGNCGTALISRGTGYREGAVGAEGMEGAVRSFYLWRVRTLHRDGTFDSFSEILTMGVIFV